MSIPVAKLVDRTAGSALIRVLAPLRWLRDLRRGDRELRAVREIVAIKFWGIGNAALLLLRFPALFSFINLSSSGWSFSQ